MAMLRGLIFDVDGTLAETEELHRISFNAAFAEAGYGWQWDQALYRKLLDITGGKERIRYYIDGWNAEPKLDAFSIQALHERKTAIYTACMAEGQLTPRPGIFRLIQEARAAGILCAIATTTSRPNIDALLRHSFGQDALSWFAAVAAGDEVERKKPAPDVYILALNRLGLRAEECLAIEDSRNGLEAALAAGLPCLITVSSYTEGQDFSEALKVVTHLGDADTPSLDIEGGMIDLTTLNEWCETVARDPV